MTFEVYYPGGNRTALVREPVQKDARSEIAKAILALHRDIEQVGFITTPTIPGSEFRLDMMGDELCINAALCAAWSDAKDSSCVFEISGLGEQVEARYSDGKVQLRLPHTVITKHAPIPEGWLVDLTGIRFIISRERRAPDTIRELLEQYASADMPAIGFIYAETQEGVIHITPWVHVRGTDSLIQESACGSGSIAAGLMAHLFEDMPSAINVRQPSGTENELVFTNSSGVLSTILFEAPVTREEDRVLPY